MSLEQKQKTYNWYYTSVTFDSDAGLRFLKFVTFATTPTQARNLALVYAEKQRNPEEKLFDLNNPVNLYQKNYIRESRALVAAGRYCGEKPETV